ncbi:MAG: SPFH domain-containing protein, partial [Oscillospiraceae bacterium]|nr:SPFH domain-containing protein [Oscillospiraceae bacterium]
MKEKKQINFEEKELNPASGWGMLILSLVLYLASVGAFIVGGTVASDGKDGLAALIFILGSLIVLSAILIDCGLKVIKPNEALVLTLFGKYTGSIKKDGFFFVNPFSTSVNPAYLQQMKEWGQKAKNSELKNASSAVRKNLSLKAMTLRNEKQKINDEQGNPIEIGVNVIWRINNTAKAVFNVDNYEDYLSTQADSALRNIVRLYPYDVSAQCDEKSLRGSSQEVADALKTELQQKVEIAGLEVIEVRITHLAYAPEIAAAMLQRQQAAAIIEARQKIVEGAVGMVEMALNKLSENEICSLDEERKAQMVSNLLVVLCGNK